MLMSEWEMNIKAEIEAQSDVCRNGDIMTCDSCRQIHLSIFPCFSRIVKPALLPTVKASQQQQPLLDAVVLWPFTFYINELM